MRVRTGDERVLDPSLRFDLLTYAFERGFGGSASEVQADNSEFALASLNDESNGIERVERTDGEFIVPCAVAPHRNGLSRCDVSARRAGSKFLGFNCGYDREEGKNEEQGACNLSGHIDPGSFYCWFR